MMKQQIISILGILLITVACGQEKDSSNSLAALDAKESNVTEERKEDKKSISDKNSAKRKKAVGLFLARLLSGDELSEEDAEIEKELQGIEEIAELIAEYQETQDISIIFEIMGLLTEALIDIILENTEGDFEEDFDSEDFEDQVDEVDTDIPGIMDEVNDHDLDCEEIEGLSTDKDEQQSDPCDFEIDFPEEDCDDEQGSGPCDFEIDFPEEDCDDDEHQGQDIDIDFDPEFDIDLSDEDFEEDFELDEENIEQCLADEDLSLEECLEGLNHSQE